MSNRNPYETPRTLSHAAEHFDPGNLPVTLVSNRHVRLWSLVNTVIFSVYPATQIWVAIIRGTFASALIATGATGGFLFMLWLCYRTFRAKTEISAVGISINWPRVSVAWEEVKSYHLVKHGNVIVTLRNGRKVKLGGPVTATREKAVIKSALDCFVIAG